jgi:hypothetical protein
VPDQHEQLKLWRASRGGPISKESQVGPKPGRKRGAEIDTRPTFNYRKWKEPEPRDWFCQICGKPGVAHHRTPKSAYHVHGDEYYVWLIYESERKGSDLRIEMQGGVLMGSCFADEMEHPCLLPANRIGACQKHHDKYTKRCGEILPTLMGPQREQAVQRVEEWLNDKEFKTNKRKLKGAKLFYPPYVDDWRWPMIGRK